MNTTVKILNDALVQVCEQLAWARAEFSKPYNAPLSDHQREDIDMALRQGAEALSMVPASESGGVVWRPVSAVIAGDLGCEDGQCRLDL